MKGGVDTLGSPPPPPHSPPPPLGPGPLCSASPPDASIEEGVTRGGEGFAWGHIKTER